MSFTSIPSSLISQGKAIYHQLWTLAKANFDDHNSRINTLEALSVAPVGAILPYGNISAPTGWRLCDGTVLSQTSFANLFAVIGSNYNTGGEGVGNFRLPDMRGRAPVGVGTGSGLTARTIGAQLGEETHPLVVGELPVHNHGVSDPTHAHTGIPKTLTSVGGVNDWETAADVSITPVKTTNVSTTGITTQNTGSGTAHANMQPFLVMPFIIKT